MLLRLLRICFIYARLLIFGVFLVSLFSCSSEESSPKKATHNTKEKFLNIDLSSAGIDFRNALKPSHELSLLNFDYYYNGSGVAIGDIDNDGLSDIYFVSNQGNDKLYKNLGNWKFEDITSSSGVEQIGGWHNGVSMVDINNDGLLDIYICRSGSPFKPDPQANLLFINLGNGQFKEDARSFGLDHRGYSTQSYFFDADQDGDLDALILNRPNSWVTDENVWDAIVKRNNKLEKDRLLINEEGVYVDRSDELGFASNIGFSLSASIVDINNDNFPDIYIANDYKQNDFYYENQGKGMFIQKIDELTNHTPYFAMGSDFEDLNNDGFADGMVVEMLPSDYRRSKTSMMPMGSAQAYEQLFGSKYHYQYMRNALYYNNGNGFLSDIGRYSNITSTDWSWSVLMNDYDNDGNRDIYVTNGFRYDVHNRDTKAEYGKALGRLIDQSKVDIYNDKFWEMYKPENLVKDAATVSEVLSIVPSNKIANAMFKSKGDFEFENIAKNWGLDDLSFSTGAAVGDLDNDGDLDMVVNNIDHEPFIYNNQVAGTNASVRIKLIGSSNNRSAIGALITCITENNTYTDQYYISRGYLSSVEPIVHIGIGKEKVQEVIVQWPDGKKSSLKNPDIRQLITMDYTDAQKVEVLTEAQTAIFKKVEGGILPETAIHSETSFRDYAVQVLLPHKYSEEGPAIAVADYNGDGLEDFFLGGSKGYKGRLFTQNREGKFEDKTSTIFEKDKAHEDVDAVFFDADGDGDVDLYVASGSVEHDPSKGGYQDRLYENEGGRFERKMNLPKMNGNTTSLAHADLDLDGIDELIIGSGVLPNQYPKPNTSFLLKNIGDKTFANISKLIPALKNIGIVSDIIWANLDGEGMDELIIVGEWMPIKVFQIQGNSFVDISNAVGFENTEGWWQTIIAEDLDGDGDLDLVAGNQGENYKFSSSLEKPFEVFADDFDKNSSYDVVLAKHYKGDRLVPIRGKDCTSEQMPFVSTKFPSFEKFAAADVGDILGTSAASALHLKSNTFSSMIFVNDGKGNFTSHKLPKEAQWGIARTIVAGDYNRDGIKDLIIAGNRFGVEPETTRADASPGYVLIGQGDLKYNVMSPRESGWFTAGDVRVIKNINIGDKPHFMIGMNKGKVELYTLN